MTLAKESHRAKNAEHLDLLRQAATAFLDADSDGDGRCTFEEFKEIIRASLTPKR